MTSFRHTKGMISLDAVNHSTLELVQFFGPKILVATLCGAMLGLERELMNKTAGLKTLILICVGSCLFSSFSFIIGSSFKDAGFMADPARIAAQILPGVGFLGGGAIIQSRGTIVGLTTAATIWVTAAIGLIVGFGYYWIGLACAGFVILSLICTRFFEMRILGRRMLFEIEILVEKSEENTRASVNRLIDEGDIVLEDFNIESEGDTTSIRIAYHAYLREHKKFILKLWGMTGVIEVKQK